MPLYEMTETTLLTIEHTSFANEHILERKHLQQLLKSRIDAIDPDLMVIGEEFGDWEDSLRRIDLLCVHRDGSLAVVEIKRDGNAVSHELQCLRYAAMISTMTFADAISALSRIDSANNSETAEQRLRQFFSESEDDENTSAEQKFNSDDSSVRIILVATDFSKELTTSVLWLQKHGIDIRCVRLTPYRHNANLLIHVEQVLPLPEASDYQIKIAKKRAEVQVARSSSRAVPADSTFHIEVNGAFKTGLPFGIVVSEALKFLISVRKLTSGHRSEEVDFSGRQSWFSAVR